MRRRTCGAIGVAVTLAACGDALVERGYRGEPLHTFQGQVTTVVGDGTFERPLRAAVFWSPSGQTVLDDRLVEQSAIAVSVRFPATFEINVFEPPASVPWDDPAAPFRVGVVLLYEDVNGDGHYQPSERRGGARNQALLFVPSPLDAAASPTGVALSAGFHDERLPMPCGVQQEDEVAEGDTCGVTLGAPCTLDADCLEAGSAAGAAARCLLRDSHTTWPGGYCVLDAAASACRPIGGRRQSTDVNGGPVGDYWHLGCSDGDDCRLSEGYQCKDNRVCVPGEPASLEIRPDFAVVGLCLMDDEEHENDD